MLDETRSLMASGVRSILIQSSTGSGKTVLLAHMLKSAAEKGFSSWFCCHRVELIDQSIRTFAEMHIDYGVIAASYLPNEKPLIQICSVNTLINRHHKYKKPRLIVWDECHHLGASTWSKLFANYPDAFHVGLSATPQRSDGKGFNDKFSSMVTGPTVEKLITDGWLSKYKLFAPTNVDMSGVHKRMGDYVQSDLAARYDKPSITGDAIREYKKRADEKRMLMFAVSIKHSEHCVEQFKNSGIAAKHVDGNTDRNERKKAIEDFKSGRIKILSNVDLFGEGFDVPAVYGVIDLAPTLSLSRFLQRAGRMLRPSPDKEFAIYLDHAGNCQRHGMPCEDREWTLQGRDIKKRDVEKKQSVKVCETCFAAQFSGTSICQYCGTPFEIKYRQVDEIEGELEEISKISNRERKTEQGSATSLDALVELGKRRGYKNPFAWSKYVFNSRQRRGK